MALALNFDGFIEAKGLFPYKNLFVSQSPALKNQTLCEFLTKIDQAEYDLIASENREITVIELGSAKWLNGIIVIDLFAVAYVGMTYLFGEKLHLAEMDNPFKKVFHIAGIFACVIALATIYWPMHAGNNRESKMSALSQKRLDRLQGKFEKIRAEYRNLKDAKSSSDDLPQLREAKRFFQSQLEKLVVRIQN